ncbi:MAG: F0F1 ATP synthase subunit B [Pseudomonadota bacterium]
MTFLAAGASFIDNPENWVVISFLIFCGILVYMGVPGVMSKALDNRAERIRKELDEAKTLRDEAQKLLAEYQMKAREAEAEAESIIKQARKDAELMAKNANEALEESLARRTRMVEDKIARAEAQALADVKSAAVSSATSAVEKIIKSRTGGGAGSSLVDNSIKSLGNRLN